MTPDGYRPHPLIRGPHLETVVPALWPAPRLGSAVEPLVVPVDEGTAVRVDLSRPAGRARGTLLLLHGMGGSAASRYMIRTAREALARGWAVARMNMRNCGGTEALSRTLYNAGQSDDADRVLADLERAGLPAPFAAAGFSLGGNTLLRYAGTSGAGCRAAGLVAVNPPIDLDACCRALERRDNAIYQAHFTRLLCRQVERVRRVRPLPGPPASPWRIGGIRRFDALFTAPDAGHPSPEAYYAHASAGPHLAAIRVPALVLSARNDPFVPVEMYDPHRSARPGAVRFHLPRRGGHVGFFQLGRPRFWAARAILDWLEGALPRG